MDDSRTMEGFEIVELDSEITDQEMTDLIAVVEKSLQDEPLFLLRIVGLSEAERREWIRQFFIQAAIDDNKNHTYAIRDTKSNALIAYAGLQCPHKESGEELKVANERREAMLNALTSRGRDFMQTFGSQVACLTTNHGYDSTKHYHKRNTLMLPEYHRRGLGTWLTRYCNDIADKAGQPTYVQARPKAWKMLEVTGFELLESVSVSTKQYGWSEDVIAKIYVRPPEKSAA